MLILAIGTYRLLISPLMGNCCRFYPSCSLYASTAVKRHGFIKGLYFTLRRLLRCHPFNLGGYDPVPRKKKGLPTDGYKKNNTVCGNSLTGSNNLDHLAKRLSPCRHTAKGRFNVDGDDKKSG